MKKIITFAAVAAGALALSACGAKKEEAPASEPTADAMAAEATPAADATPVAAETPTGDGTLDPTGNPIGPGKNPIGPQ